jgi:hypothetical protein
MRSVALRALVLALLMQNTAYGRERIEQWTILCRIKEVDLMDAIYNTFPRFEEEASAPRLFPRRIVERPFDGNYVLPDYP